MVYTERETYAWNEYLEACRECVQENYPEVEAWAWARLRRRLRYTPRKEES